MATNGDLLLATCGDFLMATDTPAADRGRRRVKGEVARVTVVHFHSALTTVPVNCALVLEATARMWSTPLRPEPRARLSPKGVEHVRAASGDPTYRQTATLMYFAAVLLTPPTPW